MKLAGMIAEFVDPSTSSYDMKKEPKKVYVVVKRSPDVSSEFVKILGIYLDKENAEYCRQDFWDEFETETSIEGYLLLDQNFARFDK